MLEKSDTSIGDTLKAFNVFDIDVGLIVPTKTGMEKSIMDATASVRDYLRDVEYHDYDTQGRGNDEHGVKRNAYFVHPDSLDKTEVSLYRPVTKSGDPRIWFGKLKRYAEPFNLLAIIIDGNDMYIVNCSDQAVMDSIRDPSSPLGEIAARRRPVIDPAAVELLDMIREISRRGFIPTLRPGDTGIGMTLETMLGIKANSSKKPDFKGIEIKSKRLKRTRDSRYELFSQIPNWSMCPIGSAWNLLRDYGYMKEKLRLSHEHDAAKPNSLGLMLDVDVGNDWLRHIHVDRVTGSKKHLLTWEMEVLRARLLEKHGQTFWVGARVRGKKHEEEFHYIQVRHTRAPKVRNFDALLESGAITMDLTLSQFEGKQRARDHGYLFKIKGSDFDALFPPVDVHVLE